jgi:hypothetical protein
LQKELAFAVEVCDKTLACNVNHRERTDMSRYIAIVARPCGRPPCPLCYRLAVEQKQQRAQTVPASQSYVAPVKQKQQQQKQQNAATQQWRCDTTWRVKTLPARVKTPAQVEIKRTETVTRVETVTLDAVLQNTTAATRARGTVKQSELDAIAASLLASFNETVTENVAVQQERTMGH